MHTSVLLKESIEGLNIKSGDVFFDGTVGAGGHSEEVAKLFGSEVRIVGTDADVDAINRASARVRKMGVTPLYITGNYGQAKELLLENGVVFIDRALFDAGLSSDQLADSGRGFSFQKDEPLLMTFAKDADEAVLTARDIVNYWEQKNIELILFTYGEERYGKRIASAIVKAREIKPIETTKDLVNILQNALPKNYEKGRIHPATRTFQALRIAVNDELGNIEKGLAGIMEMLRSGGRVAFISFHSLEDRVVKRVFKKFASEGSGIIITKKPIVPTDEEIASNPRSRSAKLRIIEKI